MAKVIVREYDKVTQVWFFCRGCNSRHHINSVGIGVPVWEWNNDLYKPTFSPSVLVEHRTPKGYSNDNPAPKGYDGPTEDHICHSFVKEGQIQYLTDSTHYLAGQTVDLEDIE